MHRNFLRITGVLLAASSIMLAKPLMAADYSFSGESRTILRMRTTIDKKDIYPVYEYLRVNATNNLSDGSGLSFYLGAWGRADLADKTTNKYSDVDLQYAYLSYRAAKSNAVVNLGRQFVSEGVAAERVDGLYFRNDFQAGIGASAFVGKSVITEPNYRGGTVIYGARISQSMPQYYTIGLSALKSEGNGNSRYREEEGVDIWLHPLQQVDLTGRSTYNSITSGWMEHAYSVSYTPLSILRISVDFSSINYKDYFFNVTTKAFNGIIDPNEKLTVVGATVSYTPIKNLTVTADHKNYNYDIAGNADYFGGKVAYSLPESFSAGFSGHRMDGDTDKLRYVECRLFAAKKIGHADLTVDAINLSYDKRVNGVKNSYALTGAAVYEVNRKLNLGADIEYSKSPDFDYEVRGLVKVIYAFDTKRAEGGMKHEK
jgi:hypothetical protein